jgi:Ca2+-binding RTX toxin-like protein
MTEAISRGGRRILVVLSAMALIGAVFTASPANAATCDGADAIASVTVAGTETVTMSGGAVQFSGATVDTCPADTQRIDVTGTGALIFDLAGGPFETADGIEVWFRLNMTGPADSVTVNGTSQADRITMGSGGVNLDGTNDEEVTEIPDTGTDISDAGVETWTLNGLAGNDVVVADGSSSGSEFPADAGAVTLNGGDGSDPLVVGGEGADTLNGGEGNDHLEGGNGNDSMNGDGGNDTFDADADPDGADAMNGGAGTDTADYSNRRPTSPVNVSLAPELVVAPATGDDGATGELDDVANMERAFGGDGDDTLTAAALTGTTAPSVTLFGGDGTDNLTGGDGNDQLLGEDDDDILAGGAGNDRMDGGDGDDTEDGGTGNDNFDQTDPRNGSDEIDGEGGVDRVRYSGRSATVTVTIDGTANDGETGEGDNISTDTERVTGGRGDDELTAGAGGSTLSGGGGDDDLTGLGGNDTLKGGGDEDTLDGAGGNDNLFGGSSADSLQGGAGNDLLNGGTGRDICRDTGGTTTRRSCP